MLGAANPSGSFGSGGWELAGGCWLSTQRPGRKIEHMIGTARHTTTAVHCGDGEG